MKQLSAYYGLSADEIIGTSVDKACEELAKLAAKSLDDMFFDDSPISYMKQMTGKFFVPTKVNAKVNMAVQQAMSDNLTLRVRRSKFGGKRSQLRRRLRRAGNTLSSSANTARLLVEMLEQPKTTFTGTKKAVIETGRKFRSDE